jgi:glycosyltransferase involved in cell wall biosynthesis
VEAGYTRLVSTPDLLACGTPQYRKKLKWLPSPLCLDELDRNYPRWQERERGEKVVVGHAYTVGSNKGTEEFLRIAAEAGRKQPLQVGLINKVQRRQALWYISQCDVYFATFLYGPGLASYEAMAFGKPVLVGCTPDELAAQRSAIGEELPFIHVTPQTCGKWLRDLTADADLRAEWGQRGRKYVEKFHDLPQVVKRLKKLYEQTKPCKFVVPA